MNSRRQGRPSGGDSEATASGSSYTSLLRSQLPDGVGDNAPYQPFVLVGNPYRSVALVARHQPDFPVIVHLDVFHSEAFGGDAYGQIAPPGFEHPIHDHRVAVLNVIVDQGDAPHFLEEGADRVGNQLFLQVNEPLDENIALRKIRSSDRPPLEQRGLFLLRQAADKAYASSLELPDFDDDSNDAQHPRFGLRIYFSTRSPQTSQSARSPV